MKNRAHPGKWVPGGPSCRVLQMAQARKLVEDPEQGRQEDTKPGFANRDASDIWDRLGVANQDEIAW